MASSASGELDNLLLVTDSYKVTHHLQYPPGTTHLYSYFESRGGKFPSTVFFGLQYIIKRWLTGPVVTAEKIAEAAEVYTSHFGPALFNEEGWNYILQEHKGCLPLKIQAVPEGTVVPYKNVLFTVENTDPKCFWLTTYFETMLMHVWYPMTVATNSYYQKLVLAKYLDETADSLASLPLQLHDFGFRGVSSVDSAGIGDAAHLVNFKATDTIRGLLVARRYYGEHMAGFSFPAAEHSTITSWGKDNELEALRHVLTKFPDRPISVVVDSYDLWKACENYFGEELKDLIVERGEHGTLAVRLDSGDPAEIVVKVLGILEDKFGAARNSKGYKRLPPYLRVLQGDSVSYESIQTILASMKEHGWSADNVVFGTGAALLQQLDRDTQKCAFKCSYALINGQGRNVYKEPITDLGKTSKKGRLSLERNGDGFTTKEEGSGDPRKDLLVTVFENGRLEKDYTFAEIRKNAEIPLLRGPVSK